MNLAIRIIISIVIGIPTLPILYVAFWIAGIAILIPIASFLYLIIGCLSSGNYLIDEGKEGFKITGMLFIAPFWFWLVFIKGENPFNELGI